MVRLDKRFVGLLVLAALPPVVEATVLNVVGFRAAEGMAPQITAVWPYDTYHDLRWLFVYHDSWPGFALGMVALVLFRASLTAGLVALSWPRQVPWPGLGWLVRRNLVLTVVIAAVVSPWAALSMAASVVALSWLLFASLVPLFLLAPFLQRAAVRGAWWRGLPSIELVGWSLLNFVVLTVGGGVVWVIPLGWDVPVAAVAGLINGLLWQRTVAAALLPRRAVKWARVPVAPLAVLLVFVVPLVVQPVLQLLPGTSPKGRAMVLDRPLPAGVRHAVIFLDGHGSTSGGQPAVDPNVQQFSYRGLDPRGQPLPYSARDTYRSIESSVGLLATQVDLLHRRTGRPVALVGHSEGALVARTYLAVRPHPVVDMLAMFSPLINAGRSYYPPAGASRGWGVAAGWELRVLFGVLDSFAHTGSGPEEPFIRSVLDNAPFYRNGLMCPVPGVRIVAFLPTTTAIEAPPGEYTRVPVFQLPALHGGLLSLPVVQARLINFLEGEPVSQPQPGYSELQNAAAAWHAPPLPLSLNPIWRAKHVPDPAFSGKICQSS
ncbi:lysophospholipase [Micromonospora sp. DR5-3]|uniref:serine aminopeptidase domain-containing protein n=1 Tax=unclassified Micromonospora TaxID=2617518 RepID=UPI0011D39A13|nr:MULTISPECIES: alpha/beta hydrolase [unclassified Micromonospora]MCW3813791.1 lysophospholipase [Micromonospora sp. DR5-3]TYC25528.1 alpha/beta hydrolase [Micromonospora sp. MP36]